MGVGGRLVRCGAASLASLVSALLRQRCMLHAHAHAHAHAHSNAHGQTHAHAHAHAHTHTEVYRFVNCPYHNVPAIGKHSRVAVAKPVWYQMPLNGASLLPTACDPNTRTFGARHNQSTSRNINRHARTHARTYDTYEQTAHVGNYIIADVHCSRTSESHVRMGTGCDVLSASTRTNTGQGSAWIKFAHPISHTVDQKRSHF